MMAKKEQKTMRYNVEKMRRDYVGAEVDEIAVDDKGYFFFVFEKNKKFFGIKVHQDSFQPMLFFENKKDAEKHINLVGD